MWEYSVCPEALCVGKGVGPDVRLSNNLSEPWRLAGGQTEGKSYIPVRDCSKANFSLGPKIEKARGPSSDPKVSVSEFSLGSLARLKAHRRGIRAWGPA